MLTALTLTLVMFLNFLVQAVNMRAVAFTRYGWIAATDALILALNFASIKMVTSGTSWLATAGYVAGGVTGALLGVWLSKHWSED